MNTFPPPPQMQPGSYQNLPPRNPRSGRVQHTNLGKADRKTAARTPQKKKAAASLFTVNQIFVLTGLCICFFIVLLVYCMNENKCNNFSAMHQQLLDDRAAQERKYQENVARHKTTFRDIIEYYAAVNNIDPAFVAAVIKRESDYDPHAVSSVGARGLMQIMPDTGEWLAGKVGIYDYHPDMLFDPEINIRMGCWYLGYLSRKFGGDPITIACAYHAGQGNVEDHWLPKYSANGKTLTLDEIPKDDTKYYARKVYEAYAIYQLHHYR